MADSYFCLDIGESYIKIVDAVKSGNMLDIKNIGCLDSDPAFFSSSTDQAIENQGAVVSKLINGLKINKKNVNIVIPDTYTFSQILQMPSLNEKELINAIKYQADQLIPLPIDEASIDVEVIYEDVKEKKIMALIVASSKKLIEKVQRVVELNGLIPDSIENEFSAVSRFISELFKTPNNQTTSFIIANVSLSSTSLYFFDPKLNLITLNHNFNIGINLFLREVMVNLNLDKQKASDVLRNYDPTHQTSYQIDTIIAPVVKEIALEIKKFINAITQKYQANINRIYLINEVINFPYLAKAIETNSSLPASLLNPNERIKKTNLVDSFRNNLSLFVTTIGGNLR